MNTHGAHATNNPVFSPNALLVTRIYAPAKVRVKPYLWCFMLLLYNNKLVDINSVCSIGLEIVAKNLQYCTLPPPASLRFLPQYAMIKYNAVQCCASWQRTCKDQCPAERWGILPSSEHNTQNVLGMFHAGK